MKIAVPAEVHPGEKRVATTPEVVVKLVEAGFEVLIESGAGVGANFSDEAYRDAGAEIARDAEALWSIGDLFIKVRPPQQNTELGVNETELMRHGTQLISFIWPAQNERLLKQLAAQKTTALAMDSIPRM